MVLISFLFKNQYEFKQMISLYFALKLLFVEYLNSLERKNLWNFLSTQNVGKFSSYRNYYQLLSERDIMRFYDY